VRIAIIGAGIAGLACAQALVAQGMAPKLFDKSRGPGGRMATRRIATAAGEATFDHGARFLTARDPAFAASVAAWAAAGVVSPWPEAGAGAWTGVPGMNAIAKHMAQGLDVVPGRLVRGITRRNGHWHVLGDDGEDGPFDAALVALPAEQAATLLGLQDLAMARTAVAARSQPCWAAMFAFGAPLPGPGVLRERGIIAWAARESARPGRTGPEAWTVHAAPEWSATQLEEQPGAIADALLAALGKATGTRDLRPIAATAHRWRFALPASGAYGALWDPVRALGACGDWLLGPSVEEAWLSGRKLAGLVLGGEALVPIARHGHA
jgi:predicted NAD/FAD-dependent oxidoreductase